jgi:hypothetical protein
VHGSRLRQFVAKPFSGGFACKKNLRDFARFDNIRGSAGSETTTPRIGRVQASMSQAERDEQMTT